VLVVPPVEVIGSTPEEYETVPGSATILTEEDLESSAPLTINEALRRVPGIHVAEEEGMGLRQNIGFRGLDPDRSRTVLILEDGVPIATLPYGGPGLYYAPPIERIERIEVIKGSGSILFGPQTIGGVVNYITPDPPEDFTVGVEVRGGTLDYFTAQASMGDTQDWGGYFVEVLHQRSGGHRLLDLALTDAMAKLVLDLSDDAWIELKLNAYDEFSHATYLGLTTPQLAIEPAFNFAVNDVLPVQRYGGTLSHSQWLSDELLLQTTLYGHYITRDWQRQDFERSDSGAEYERIFDGEGDLVDTASDDGSAIFFLPSFGTRARSFTVGGLETRATWETDFGDLGSEMTFGVRAHLEGAHIRRINGPLDDPDETLRDDETHSGLGIAAYVLERLTFCDRFRVSPGLRFESYSAERRIDRQRVEGVPTDLDPPIVESTTTTGIIPGLGLSYDVAEELTAFAGLHRGFAPPRTQDAITSEGENLDLDAELSWNVELGLRFAVDDYVSGEIAGFLLDFSNQIIEPTEAGGAAAASESDLINSGSTRHIGVESALRFDIGRAAEADFDLPLDLTYTFVRARFGEGWSEELQGLDLPYAPDHHLTASLGIEFPMGFAAHISANYVAEQFSDRENTEEPSLDGLTGIIPDRVLIDARLAYTHDDWGATAYLLAKNLLDERYIASRRPRGIQPGSFQQLILGVRAGF
jgi:Fe(3+) dicitrate transport protein